MAGSQISHVQLLRERTPLSQWSWRNCESLAEMDKATVGEALRAAADAPFFPDREFHTLFGFEREELRAIADAWPRPAASHEDVTIAVHHSLRNLLGYPHNHEGIWSQWISVEPSYSTSCGIDGGSRAMNDSAIA